MVNKLVSYWYLLMSAKVHHCHLKKPQSHQYFFVIHFPSVAQVCIVSATVMLPDSPCNAATLHIFSQYLIIVVLPMSSIEQLWVCPVVKSCSLLSSDHRPGSKIGHTRSQERADPQ